MHTAVVIVAAGRGTRARSGALAKQYQDLGGAPVLARTLDTFISHPSVDGVLTVIHPDDRDHYTRTSAAYAQHLLEPVPGGATRQDSVRAGLKALENRRPRNVLIHDAVRPFVSHDLVARVIEALEDNEGAVPALPVADTLKEEKGGHIVKTLKRDSLWAAQTPQGFRFKAILAAHNAAAGEGKREFTDDSAVAEWRGLSVALVEGAAANLKLTTREDFELAEARLAAAGESRAAESCVGHGFDVHAFTAGNHVMLCGVKVPHERGLAGHSDADAGLHALTDALLGAIADEDIGAHFPPSDAVWKDAASDAFLREASQRVQARNGRIVNVDVTLICEAPEIGPHRQAMRARIAEILDIPVERVSVKATTTEGLGFTGRGEGIAAQATATVSLG